MTICDEVRPTLIEAVTYRMSMHTTADDPKKYRKEDEVKEWEPRDPLLRFRTYLHKKGLLDESAAGALDAEIAAETEQAVREYEQYRQDPAEFLRHMYAELTPELQAQQAELQAYLKRKHAPAPAAQPDLAGVS